MVIDDKYDEFEEGASSSSSSPAALQGGGGGGRSGYPSIATTGLDMLSSNALESEAGTVDPGFVFLQNNDSFIHPSITSSAHDALSLTVGESGIGKVNPEFHFLPNHYNNYINWAYSPHHKEEGEPLADLKRYEPQGPEKPSIARFHTSGPVRSQFRTIAPKPTSEIEPSPGTPNIVAPKPATERESLPAASSMTDVLDKAALKKEQNKMAARRSRIKKTAEFQQLRKDNERLQAENAKWRDMAVQIFVEDEKDEKEKMREPNKNWKMMAFDIIDKWTQQDLNELSEALPF